MRIPLALTMCVALAMLPATGDAAGAEPTRGFEAPESVVWLMFDRFEHMDTEGYVSAMAADYRFDSDEPGFATSSPNGMNREDERLILTHMVQGMPERHLPALAYVTETLGPMRVSLETTGDGRTNGVLENYRIQLVFKDSTRMQLGATRSEFELVLTESGWRVRRWHESTRAPVPDTPIAAGQQTGQPAIATTLPRLGMSAHADRARGSILFDVDLAGSGGALDLFDVQGRRVAGRDLAGMDAGRHTITIDAAEVPVGVYWARVRQPGAAVSTRVLWTR